MLKKVFPQADWILLLLIVPVMAAGLITMRSFDGDALFFNRQIIWISVSILIYFFISSIDLSFLKSKKFILFLYIFALLLLTALFFVGYVSKGSERWFNFGIFSFQPVDFMKITLILVLSKYFSRRHVEIKNVKHLFVSGTYFIMPFLLVFLQPDLGSAIILFLIWIGMVWVSGISRKHIFFIFMMALIAFTFLWLFFLQDYQKNRIKSFLDPLSDIQGTGYNAYQSVVAVGSGQFLGKGVGYGTQSRLNFLPEHQTDFIFAAFSEEWGFVGSFVILILYFLIVWRIIIYSLRGSTNFEILYGVGVAIMIMSHVVVNIGMNIGLMPITGLNLPFMSYGGTNLMINFAALGVLSSMSRYRKFAHDDDVKNEFLGI